MPGDRAATVAPARRCAFTVLRRVFEGGAYADHALQAAAAGLDARDRGLAMALAYGAVQRRGTLDWVIDRLSSRPSDELDGQVLAALRLGLHELLFMGGAPDYAVVADAVELAKGGGGHGLVNAVLRRAAREGPQALLGELDERTPEQAAVMHSHPTWVARLWWRTLGADGARALMRADNEPGEVALRANTLVTSRERLALELGVRTRPGELAPESLVLEQPFDEHASPLWQSGAFIAQARAAMLPARLLAPRAGDRVLDLCAAPGGKSTQLAALMGDDGLVVAVERSRRRAGALEQAARRLHAGSVRVELADAAEPRAAADFERVLVDPPCSGLGTLQARADLRWRVTPQAVAQMAGVQARILAAGAHALRSGGTLVYSTCTVSPDENERLIAAFLDSHADFELDDLTSELPALAWPALPGTLQTLPDRDRTAGFFIARMRRT